jgi:hypothetical protein
MVELNDITENFLLLLMRRHGGTVRITAKEWEAHNGIWEEWTYVAAMVDGEYQLDLVRRNK